MKELSTVSVHTVMVDNVLQGRCFVHEQINNEWQVLYVSSSHR